MAVELSPRVNARLPNALELAPLAIDWAPTALAPVAMALAPVPQASVTLPVAEAPPSPTTPMPPYCAQMNWARPVDGIAASAVPIRTAARATAGCDGEPGSIPGPVSPDGRPRRLRAISKTIDTTGSVVRAPSGANGNTIGQREPRPGSLAILQL